MGEPARKLDTDVRPAPRSIPDTERGRVIRLPAAAPTLSDDERWLLEAIMACYCCGRD